MLNKLVVLICTLLLVACDDKPSFIDIEKNFTANRAAFDELAKIACKLGQTKQPFSYTVDSFSYSPDKIKANHRIKAVDILLMKLGGNGVNYKKTMSGKCSLVIGYYARGFAGSGISYSYGFQIEPITPHEKEIVSFEKITATGKAAVFDKPLAGGWYFTFKYT